MDQASIELIERYLEGALSPEELSGVEARIASDPAFAEEVSFRKHLDAALGDEEFSRLEAAVKRADARYFEEKAETPVRPLWPRFVGAAAAVVALLVVAWWVWNPGPTDPEQLFAGHFEAYPVYSNLRSGDKSDSLMSEGFALYTAGEYEEAIVFFRQASQMNAGDSRADFYLGVSLLASDKPGEAIAPLEGVRKQSRSALRQPATWYLALGYIRSGENERAEPLLQELKEEKGSYAEKAKALLREL